MAEMQTIQYETPIGGTLDESTVRLYRGVRSPLRFAPQLVAAASICMHPGTTPKHRTTVYVMRKGDTLPAAWNAAPRRCASRNRCPIRASLYDIDSYRATAPNTRAPMHTRMQP
eukprot:6210519-Pleurochrysis_carterae.AAC.1